MKIKLTVLGSGISTSSFYNEFDYRNTSSHLLQINDKNILFDCGEGVRGQLSKLDIDYFNINAILISHLHPDHFNLDPLMQSMFTRAKLLDTRKQITIFGPKDVEKVLKSSWDNKHFSGDYEKELMQALDIVFLNAEDREKTLLLGVDVIPFRVSHPIPDPFAYRMLIGEKTIAYSGDTGDSDSLIELASESNIFLCEAATNIGEPENPGHLSSFQAGEIAKKANAKHVVIVHYSGKDSKQDMEREIERAGFTGIVSIASDLDSFEV